MSNGRKQNRKYVPGSTTTGLYTVSMGDFYSDVRHIEDGGFRIQISPPGCRDTARFVNWGQLTDCALCGAVLCILHGSCEELW